MPITFLTRTVFLSHSDWGDGNDDTDSGCMPPLLDAFPKSFDPLKTPGLIPLDRPSRFAQQNLSRIGLN
jgi:hypothetical protein